MSERATVEIQRPNIFISFASIDDNVPPDEPEAFGFVDYLRRKLRYELRQLGGKAPDLWLGGDWAADNPFEPLFEGEVQNASLLLVVLSRNWITDLRCLQELKQFRDKFHQSEPEERTRRRIVVVAAENIDASEYPNLLPRELCYAFYHQDREDEKITPFFAYGEPGPQQYLKSLYNQQVKKLAQHLWDEVRSLGGAQPELPKIAQAQSPAPPHPEPTQFPQSQPQSSPRDPVPGQARRRVFVAKPANDMKGPYSTLVHELTGPGRGYEVVPSPESEMPDDSAEARAYFESALASAEVSIHLLGDRPGYAPAGGVPMVQLQLWLAGSQTYPVATAKAPDPQPSSYATSATVAPPHVFISYSHDNEEHKTRILDLADKLRTDGIDAMIDQYVQLPGEGWPTWCEAQIRKADFVLMVCTETYLRRVNREDTPGTGDGVLWEARLIKQFIYDEGSDTTKFVPVILEGGSRDHVPVPVKGATLQQVDTQVGYEALLRLLTDQPLARMPPLGPRRNLAPRRRPMGSLQDQASDDSGLPATLKPRLIWAPKVLPDVPEGTPERDSQAVLAKVQGGKDILRSQDKLVSETLVNFIQFVIQHLEAEPPLVDQPRISADGQVYLGFDESDLNVAALVGNSLRLLNIDPEITGTQGDLARLDARRQEQLQKCDSVLLCWSRAEEIWVRSFADQLDWKRLKRDRPFSCRSVVQLQPPDEVKEFFRQLPPRRYIDVVIDATKASQTTKEIAELLRQQLLTRP